EIDVFTLQDNYTNPAEPTEAMTFSQYGIVDFKVQYWNGTAWTAVTDGVVTGNNKVWRKFSFSNITTDQIRVRVTSALASYSRVTEIEAYQPNNSAYDAAGNVTNDGVHSYSYDAENRLVSVDNGATASYKYDHQNRRVSKAVGSSLTHYVWQGSQVIAEHDATTPLPGYGQPPYQVQSARVDYVYAGGKMVYSTQRTSSTGAWMERYYLGDRLSTRVVLDASGNVLGRQGHLPFGEDFAESGTQEKHHFTSYERDGENGSDYAINRQYSQSTGRFIRVDPFSGSSQTGNAQSLNRYSYSQNDPINGFDPLGLLRVICSTTISGSIWRYEGIILGVSVSANSFCMIVADAGMSRGEGSSGPDLLDLLKKFWDLNPCEKTAAMNTPFPFLEGIVEAERIAQKVAKAFGDQDNDYGNAVKHCTWSCEMARRTNQYWAEQWGTAHECDKKGRKDRDRSALMDLHNNAVGRELAKKPESEGSCATLCSRCKDIQTSP
ncbi:MAG: RHS repeat-associated core domain-containing protein, partial [Acidobacteriota bacterium]